MLLITPLDLLGFVLEQLPDGKHCDHTAGKFQGLLNNEKFFAVVFFLDDQLICGHKVFNQNFKEEGLDAMRDTAQDAEVDADKFLICSQQPHFCHINGSQDAYLIVECVDKDSMDSIQPKIRSQLPYCRETS